MSPTKNREGGKRWAVIRPIIQAVIQTNPFSYWEQTHTEKSEKVELFICANMEISLDIIE